MNLHRITQENPLTAQRRQIETTARQIEGLATQAELLRRENDKLRFGRTSDDRPVPIPEGVRTNEVIECFVTGHKMTERAAVMAGWHYLKLPDILIRYFSPAGLQTVENMERQKQATITSNTLAGQPGPLERQATLYRGAMTETTRPKFVEEFTQAERDKECLLRFIRDFENDHFRSTHDTGSEPHAMNLWNLVRFRAGLSQLTREDLPQYNSQLDKYVRPAGSGLLGGK